MSETDQFVYDLWRSKGLTDFEAKIVMKSNDLYRERTELTAQLDKCRKALEPFARLPSDQFRTLLRFARKNSGPWGDFTTDLPNEDEMESAICLASTTLAELEAGKGREG